MHNESVTRRLLVAATLGVAVLLAWYAVRLDRRVGERLGGDAGHAHSRFFPAPFRITAGQDVGVVLQRLDELGYRNDRELAAPGTWRRRAGALEVWLRALPDVDSDLPESHARLDLDGTTVRAIVDVATGTGRPHATLEPAPLDV